MLFGDVAFICYQLKGFTESRSIRRAPNKGGQGARVLIVTVVLVGLVTATPQVGIAHSGVPSALLQDGTHGGGCCSSLHRARLALQGPDSPFKGQCWQRQRGASISGASALSPRWPHGGTGMGTVLILHSSPLCAALRQREAAVP